MNERILELAKQATLEFSLAFERDKWQEKFAELIIAECCVALHPMLRDMISRAEGVEMIVRHFRSVD
jgi:hypothetical protein